MMGNNCKTYMTEIRSAFVIIDPLFVRVDINILLKKLFQKSYIHHRIHDILSKSPL